MIPETGYEAYQIGRAFAKLESFRLELNCLEGSGIYDFGFVSCRIQDLLDALSSVGQGE